MSIAFVAQPETASTRDQANNPQVGRNYATVCHWRVADHHDQGRSFKIETYGSCDAAWLSGEHRRDESSL
jgi:hypothetical protein